jgi:hypothetical protein
MKEKVRFLGLDVHAETITVGESSNALCDRPSRTRDTSQRQLPTDHDYATSTREYQTDQSSLKTASTAAGPALGKRQETTATTKTTSQIRRS